MGLPLADFLIIGAQRCGTTSMHRYLNAHPQIAMQKGKEINFFNDHYSEGIEWYASHLGDAPIRGDKTPNYVVDPTAPSRIKETIPNAKFIFLVRNPVDRIWSHYQHIVRGKLERRPFEVALYSYPGRPDGWFPYLKRGYYAEQLTHWLQYFPWEQFHVVHSERFFSNTDAVYNETLEFLDASPCNLKRYRRGGGYHDTTMRPDLRELRVHHYRSYNEALYDLLGKDLGWER